METVTRYACEGARRWMASPCPAEPDSDETCACEARVFEVVREPGRTPRLVDPNESAGRDEGIVRPADQHSGRES